jgi:hypothetical protein
MKEGSAFLGVIYLVAIFFIAWAALWLIGTVAQAISWNWHYVSWIFN